MSTRDEATRPCPRCGARVRVNDAWCSLCYAPLGSAEATATVRTQAPVQPQPQPQPQPQAQPHPQPQPQPQPPQVQLPAQRRGPLLPGRRLVGGEIAADVLDDLTARLAAEAEQDRPVRRVGRRTLVAAGGAAAVLAVLLAGMWLLGTLL